MRRLFTLCFVLGLLFTSKADAQGIWFDVGANYTWGPTFLLNKNINTDRNYDHEFTFGQSFGLKLGINNGYYSGFHLVYNYATGAQDFDYIEIDGAGMNVSGLRNEIEWNTHDFMLLYRYSGQGAYVEFGPKYSMFNSYTQVTEGVDATSPLLAMGDPYEDYISGVFGFGSYIAGSDVVQISMGIRLAYSFTDFVSDDGQTANFPQTALYNKEYESYSPTSPISAQLNVELTYAFGSLAKTSCGGRRKLILFGG